MKVNNHVINDSYLKDCCAICEAYTGNEHFYGDCTRCPAYRMAEKLKATENELSNLKYQMSWIEFPDRMGK